MALVIRPPTLVRMAAAVEGAVAAATKNMPCVSHIPDTRRPKRYKSRAAKVQHYVPIETCSLN